MEKLSHQFYTKHNHLLQTKLNFDYKPKEEKNLYQI